MKIVKPSHEILIPENPYKHIEKIGRICYRSENSITETSAEPFINRLFKSGHHAMLEHFRFIVEVHKAYYNVFINSEHSKYITFTNDDRCVISASARGLCDMYNLTNSVEVKCCVMDIVSLIVNKYNCHSLFGLDSKSTRHHILKSRIITDFNELSDHEYKMHAWYSVHFVCDRGVTHEMVRHRDASFAQESTRYCNYSKGKYGNEITVIKPLFWEEGTDSYKVWRYACQQAEDTYLDLLGDGCTAQEARSVLPNSLKTEIVITAQVHEWLHIFNLRVLGITGAPHPQMKEVMEPVYNEMLEKLYI